MYGHILIPVAIDHEPVVPQKIELARKLLGEGGKITLLTVLENVSGFVAEFVTVKSENHLSQRIAERLREVAAGADDIGVHVATGNSGVEICRYAQAQACHLIIVGSMDLNGRDYRLGTTASRVVRRAHCPVFVLR